MAARPVRKTYWADPRIPEQNGSLSTQRIPAVSQCHRYHPVLDSPCRKNLTGKQKFRTKLCSFRNSSAVGCLQKFFFQFFGVIHIISLFTSYLTTYETIRICPTLGILFFPLDMLWGMAYIIFLHEWKTETVMNNWHIIKIVFLKRGKLQNLHEWEADHKLGTSHRHHQFSDVDDRFIVVASHHGSA